LTNFQIVHGNTKSNHLHHQIFEAIKGKDAEKARAVMTEHLSDVLDKVRLDAARTPQALREEENGSGE
jgi:DNA-binding GntR family transcriptional regulator